MIFSQASAQPFVENYEVIGLLYFCYNFNFRLLDNGGTWCVTECEEFRAAERRRRSNGNLDVISFVSYIIVCFVRCAFPLSERGRRVAGVELRHLAGQPGSGGV